ncbi:hypothetical protein [Gymnodinialimonas hymeniacidonis]|uniref:hypothetical protein n=1 Tax=Gymnodinialimonas hymeniacidonis TaxID=3126508 RepID=UPI0034C6BD29
MYHHITTGAAASEGVAAPATIEARLPAASIRATKLGGAAVAKGHHSAHDPPRGRAVRRADRTPGPFFASAMTVTYDLSS